VLVSTRVPGRARSRIIGRSSRIAQETTTSSQQSRRAGRRRMRCDTQETHAIADALALAV
jgi:hypothetical protein